MPASLQVGCRDVVNLRPLLLYKGSCQPQILYLDGRFYSDWLLSGLRPFTACETRVKIVQLHQRHSTQQSFKDQLEVSKKKIWSLCDVSFSHLYHV